MRRVVVLAAIILWVFLALLPSPSNRNTRGITACKWTDAELYIASMGFDVMISINGSSVALLVSFGYAVVNRTVARQGK